MAALQFSIVLPGPNNVCDLSHGSLTYSNGMELSIMPLVTLVLCLCDTAKYKWSHRFTVKEHKKDLRSKDTQVYSQLNCNIQAIVSNCGATLQTGPHLCTRTTQSSIWLRNLAWTRAQVEKTMVGATENEEKADRMTSWHTSLESQLLSPPSTSPFFSPTFLIIAPQDSVNQRTETKPSQLHLVIISRTPAASSPCLLSCLF